MRSINYYAAFEAFLSVAAKMPIVPKGKRNIVCYSIRHLSFLTSVIYFKHFQLLACCSCLTISVMVIPR